MSFLNKMQEKYQVSGTTTMHNSFAKLSDRVLDELDKIADLHDETEDEALKEFIEYLKTAAEYSQAKD